MILAEMKPFNDLLFFSLPTTHTMTRINKFYSKKVMPLFVLPDYNNILDLGLTRPSPHITKFPSNTISTNAISNS